MHAGVILEQTGACAGPRLSKGGGRPRRAGGRGGQRSSQKPVARPQRQAEVLGLYLGQMEPLEDSTLGSDNHQNSAQG